MNTTFTSYGIMIAGFYESISAQESYFIVMRRLMEISSIFNAILVSASFYIIVKEGTSMKPDYRNVLFFNLLLPAIFSLYMGFIYQPYIIFPYHFLLTIGFFRLGPFVTAHLFNICCSLAILCSMGFIYSFWFNYITICFRLSRRNTKQSNLVGLIVGLIFTICNFILMTIGVNEKQYDDWHDLSVTDPRIKIYLESYSIAIVRVEEKWSLKVLSIEAFIGISIVTIVIPIITVKSYTTLNRIHDMISRQTLVQLKSALAISLWYLLQFGILVGIPAAFAMGLLLTYYTPSTIFPVAMLVLIPTQLTCPVICVLYLTVIKPLRAGVLRRLGFAQALGKIGPNSQSQISTLQVTSRRNVSTTPYSSIRLY